MSVLWVCSCLWCLVPEFLVIFDCILVFTFEKFGMSGCGVGEKYFPQKGCAPGLLGTPPVQDYPKPNSSLGFLHYPGDSNGAVAPGRSCTTLVSAFTRGVFLRGGSPATSTFRGPGLGFLSRHLVNLSLIKVRVFWNQQITSG